MIRRVGLVNDGTLTLAAEDGILQAMSIQGQTRMALR
jgi:hypothetical protein